MITVQANKKRRSILIFDGIFNLEDSHDFPESMFDAIYIFSTSPDEVKSILNVINPVTSIKCCYKPFLVSRSLKGKLDEYDELIDHYTDDIDDDVTLNVVEDIIVYKDSLGLRADDNNVMSSNLFFVRLCRYLISRKRYIHVPEPQEGSGLGYIIPIFNLFFKIGLYSLKEYIAFYQTMLEKQYFSVTGFINKIYLCPDCLHSHLLYIESCPQCHSSSIKSEEVIHHFRCANISPEHTYNYGGQLRCPKCHHLLRHIGVDYDRPSMVFTCSNCDNNFLQPQMKALCTACHHSTDVSSLTPHDVTAFEITKDGQEAIISPNIGIILSIDIFDNYLGFDKFLSRIELLIDQESTESGVSVAKIWVLDGNESTRPLKTEMITSFCQIFTNQKVSSGNNMIYLNNVSRKGSRSISYSDDELRKDIEETLMEYSHLIAPGEKICYAISHFKSDAEAFIKSLYYVEDVPEKEYEYSDAPIVSDSVETDILEIEETNSPKQEIVDEAVSETKSAGNARKGYTNIVLFILLLLAVCLIMWLIVF